MNRRLHILIFSSFLLCFAYFYNGGGGNQAARMNLTRAIVLKHSFNLNGVAFPSDDHIRLNGGTYSSKAPGTSFMGVLPYALTGWPLERLGVRSVVAKNLAAHFTITVAVGVPCALAMLALYLTLTSMGVRGPMAYLGALSIGVGTTYFPYATMFFGHSLAGALAFLSYYLLREAHLRRKAGTPPGLLVFYAALLVGAAVLTEYPVAILAILLTFYLLTTRPSLKEFGYWLGGGGVAIGALFFYNWQAFGDPLAVSYLNYARSSHNSFPQHAKGLAGIVAPNVQILKEILWGDERGILLFSPVVVLLVPALFYLVIRRRDLWREGVLVLLTTMGFLAFNAGYGDSIRYWGGANSAGPRHLIPAFPFIGLAIGLLIGAMPAPTLLVIIPSFVIALAVTAVMPQIPMYFPHPLKQFIFPYFLESRLSVHRGGLVVKGLVTDDSVAYNLGKLVGIPTQYSLIPLIILLFFLVTLIMHEFARSSAVSRTSRLASLGALATLLSALIIVPLLYQNANAITFEGKGVRAVYFPGDACEGRPLKVTREENLQFKYTGDDLRPDPSTFCARFSGMLEVPRDGAYGFLVHGAPAQVMLDHRVVIDTDRTSGHSLPVELTAGTHVLQVQAVFKVLNQSFSLRWKPPESMIMPIPPNRLRTPGAPPPDDTAD